MLHSSEILVKGDLIRLIRLLCTAQCLECRTETFCVYTHPPDSYVSPFCLDHIHLPKGTKKKCNRCKKQESLELGLYCCADHYPQTPTLRLDFLCIECLQYLYKTHYDSASVYLSLLDGRPKF